MKCDQKMSNMIQYMLKNPGTSFSQEKKPLRGATQHRTGFVNKVFWVIYVICVINVIKVINVIDIYAHLRKIT